MEVEAHLHVSTAIGELLNSLEGHERTSALLLRSVGLPYGTYLNLYMLGHVGKEEQVRVEEGKAIMEDAETEEERDHDSLRDDMSRSGVNIAEGLLQHGHEFDLI